MTMSKMERKFENKKIKRKSKLEFFFFECAQQRERRKNQNQSKKKLLLRTTNMKRRWEMFERKSKIFVYQVEYKYLETMAMAAAAVFFFPYHTQFKHTACIYCFTIIIIDGTGKQCVCCWCDYNTTTTTTLSSSSLDSCSQFFLLLKFFQTL